MERDWKNLISKICKDACNYSGTSYEFSFRFSDDKDVFYITFTPKIESDTLISFHIMDIQKIEGIIYRRCRFISVQDRELELTFMR